MFTTIGLFAAGLFGKSQIADKTGKIIGIVLVAVVAIGLIFGAKALYDHSLISAHDNERKAQEATATLTAQRKADTAAAARQEVTQARQKQIEQAVAAAKQAEPEKAAKPVGPVSQSYYDNLPRKKKGHAK